MQQARAPTGDAIRTVLVQVRADDADRSRLDTAVELAGRFDATLLGLGCEAVPPLGAADPTGLLDGDWYFEMGKQATASLERSAETFRQAAAGRPALWALGDGLPGPALARASGAADIVVMDGGALATADPYRRAQTAEVVLTSGRPVLVVPADGGRLRADAVVVAWKDTREARRALADAMPFLVAARDVVVAEVCDPRDTQDAEGRTAAVVGGLQRHGAAARARVVCAPPEGVFAELNTIARSIDADLIVAGGYGHSRLGEWVFGGVTRDLLHRPERFALLSH